MGSAPPEVSLLFFLIYKGNNKWKNNQKKLNHKSKPAHQISTRIGVILRYRHVRGQALHGRSIIYSSDYPFSVS